MKTIVLISAIAEWNAVKPMFSNAKLQQFPFGEWEPVEVLPASNKAT
jgi:hypothetical protein